MPWIKPEHHITAVLSCFAERRGCKIEDILSEAGCFGMITFIRGDTDFIHEDDIDNFTHWLFPRDWDREGEQPDI